MMRHRLEIVLRIWRGGRPYGVLPELIITRSVYVRNQSSEKIYVNKVMSAELDFLTEIRLRFLRKTCHGAKSESTGGFMEVRWIGSVCGTSSHQHNPDDDPGREGHNRDHEAAMHALFVQWNFQGEVLKDQYNQTRMLLV